MANNNDNSYLISAQTNKKDEFYTSLNDIAIEFKQGEYAEQFKGKNILCNCNDAQSNFYRFFSIMFSRLELNSLTAVSFGDNAYKLVKTKDGVTKTPIKGNGDFASEEGIALLDQCDIVCTNPPFSLFHDYLLLVIEHDKHFLLFGNINTITTKDLFWHFTNGRFHLGCSIHSGDREFEVPPNYPMNASTCRIDEDGNRFINVKSVRWITDLETPEIIPPIPLTCHYYGNEDAYPKYTNLDAIEVNPTKSIPYDYEGMMGVPITFLDVFCPDQFEILGVDVGMTANGKATVLNINGEEINKYTRLIIRNKKFINKECD